MAPIDTVRADNSDDEAWYRDRFGGVNVWVIAPGEGARLWREFQERGIAAIGNSDLGDLREYPSRKDIHSALIKSGAGENPSMKSLARWQFVHEIKIGDVLLAKRGRTAILGWGKVTGDYTYEPERVEYRNLRNVEWHPCPAPISLDGPITTKALTSVVSHKYAYGDARAFWLSARGDDEQWPLPREEEQRSRRPKGPADS